MRTHVSVRVALFAVIVALGFALAMGCRAEGEVDARGTARTERRTADSDWRVYTDRPTPAPAATPAPEPAAADVGPVDQPGHVPTERGRTRDQVTVPADEPTPTPAPVPAERPQP